MMLRKATAKQSGPPAWEAINKQDSSAVAMRSVAAALQGQFLDVWNIDKLQQRALELVSLGGKKAVIGAVERFIANSGVDPKWAKRIRTSHLANWAVSLYDDVEGAPWDAIIIGSPNGGVTHLATALGVPFLSQHFITSFQDPTDADDVETYFAHGAELAAHLLRRNKDIAIVNHYDPLHDRFLVKHVNHIRYKLLEIPETYEAFIDCNLRPGGTIIFTDCRYPWPMYFIGERHWFQVGGLGALSPWSFIQGEDPDIAALQETNGTDPVGNWGLKGHHAFEMPESEWGALPPLHQRLERFAREKAYQFVAIEGAHPEYFSYLAFRLWQRILKHADVEPQGILLETFTQVAPAAIRAAALLPIWLPWNCMDSLEFLQRVRRDFGQTAILRQKPVLWMPLPNFVETFDMASWEDWMEALHDLDVRTLGMHPHLYPADPSALYATLQDIMTWVDEHPRPVKAKASIPMLLEEIRALRRQRIY